MLYLDDIQHCIPSFCRSSSRCATPSARSRACGSGQHAHLRPARRRSPCDGRQPVHRERREVPDSRTCSPTAPTSTTSATSSATARGRVRAELPRERPHVESRARAAAQRAAEGRLRRASSMAERGPREGHRSRRRNYSPEELEEILAVMRKLMRVRDVVLTRQPRNTSARAAQADEYRTEPPFKLQGSYRNMNRSPKRSLPVMNDAELHTSSPRATITTPRP